MDQSPSTEENPYTLFITNPNILFEIKSIATQNKAKLVQRDGKPFTPYEMSYGKPSQILKLETFIKREV